MSTYIPRVEATEAARAAVASLARAHGPLVLVQSAGCCDGSALMCIRADDFPLGGNDIRVGEVDGVPVLVSARELRAWHHCDFEVDLEPGYADGLSLAPEGSHFVSLPIVCVASLAHRPPSTGA